MKLDWQGEAFQRYGVPVLFLIIGCILLISLHIDERIDWTRNNHPATWPQLMTFGLMLVAGTMLLWGLYDIWKEHRNARNGAGLGSAPSASVPKDQDGLMSAKEADLIASEGNVSVNHNDKLMVLGLIGVFTYGLGVEYIGFAFATIIIIAYWLLIWGIRNPITIVLTSGIGTASILFIFIKWAYLPLPKGTFFFDDLTVGLYRLLGLF